MEKSRRIAVLAGGFNEERALSLQGGQDVYAVLSKNHKNVRLIDWQEGQDLPTLLRDVDVCFNCLHGTKGEDGTVAGVCEILDIAYTFSGMFGSVCGSDKGKTKELLRGKPDVMIVPGQPIRMSEFNPKEKCPVQLPVMVKDPATGSSKGVWLCKTQEEYVAAVAKISAPEGMVERFIPGDDIVVTMLQDGSGVHVWPVMEFETDLEWQDNASKNTLWGWDGGGGKPVVVKRCPPKKLSPKMQAKAVTMAKAIYHYLRARTALNVEFRVTGEDIYFIECSVIPAMTSTSVHAACAQAAGVSFAELVERMLVTATTDNGPSAVPKSKL